MQVIEVNHHHRDGDPWAVSDRERHRSARRPGRDDAGRELHRRLRMVAVNGWTDSLAKC